MAIAEALSIANGLLNVVGTAWPILNTIFGGNKTSTSSGSSQTTAGGSVSQSMGSSASQQTGMGQTIINMTGSETGNTSQTGSISSLGSLLANAMNTPTSNNSLAAFAGNLIGAATANRLQQSNWDMANAMNAYNVAETNKQTLEAVTSARQYNSNEAQKERDWARMMRQTAYQDTVKDMQAAGLNPILAASRGATETPSGASASASTGGIGLQSASAAAIPSAHAASAQAMYDYGNNTAQFLNNAMATINNAKQYGYEQVAKTMFQDMLSIQQSSSKSIHEEATKTEQWAQTDLSQWSEQLSKSTYGDNLAKGLQAIFGNDGGSSGMGGGQSHGGGGGRNR